MIGQCYQCKCKIGAKSANGVFRYNSKMRQVEVVYSVPRKVNYQEAFIVDAVHVHAPVCANCVTKIDVVKLHAGLMKDAGVKDFINKTPEAEIVKVIQEI